MNDGAFQPPRNGEGDRAKRGGGESKFVARPEVIRARQLRKDMTKPERMLWQRLRQRPEGYKFRRQHPIGPYIADFCCLSERFVVEIAKTIDQGGLQPGNTIGHFQFLSRSG